MTEREADFQKQAVQFLRTALKPERACVFVVPNARQSRRVSGFRPGAPDLTLIVGGQYYGVELKAKTGVVSDEQEAMHREIEAAGGVVFVSRSIADLESIVATVRMGRAA